MKKQLLKLLLLLGQILVFALISALIILLLSFGLRLLFPESGVLLNGFNFQSKPLESLIFEYFPQVVGYLGAILLIDHWIFPNSLSGHGLNFHRITINALKGWGLAMAMICIVFLILLAFGKIDDLSAFWDTHLFFGFLLLFIFQSTSEELMTRSFLVPVVENKFGVIAAVMTSGLLFALLHIWNPNISLIGIWNIYLAGIMFALFLVKYRSIWQISFLHAGWNFTQGSFFDFNVSGLDFWSFIRFQLNGKDWLTGGDFGIEGSLLSLILLLGVVGWLMKTMYAGNLIKEKWKNYV